MSKHLTLTIGIPAYNEGENIKKLVRSILDQKTNGFVIEKVIISSDASTDNTVQKVESIRDNRVILINNNKRAGIARGLNQIIENCNSDILVTLDADIKIINKNFLGRLIKPIIDGNADLTSSAIREILPETRISHILNTSMRLKEILFRTFKNGDNVYSCHGLARAYSRSFYSSLNFPVSIGNDMYAFLKCKTEGFKFEYTKEAKVYYRLPENFEDHKKQSERFFVTEKEMERIFGKEVVTIEVHIPLYVYLVSFFRAIPMLLKNPMDSLMYFFIQLFLRNKPKSSWTKLQAWNMAVSSKRI